VHQVFSLIDREEKGWIGLHDLERLLQDYKISAKSLISDLMLVMAAFDGSGKR
jgi:Ca2+-binding EF-hand superfamily protein